MEISQQKRGAVLELAMRGRLDAEEAGHLDGELEQLVRNGEHRICLELSALDYISSAGIRILLKYFKLLRSLNGALALARPSEVVRSVLHLTGLTELLVKAEGPAEPAQAPAGATRRFGPLVCTPFTEVPGATLTCRLVGTPGHLSGPGFNPDVATPLQLPQGTLAVGLGAFGRDASDCRDRFGEFVAAGGAAVCLPAGGAHEPDYVIASGGLIPEVHALYAIVGEGRYAQCLRFETDANEAGSPISAIVSAALELTGASAAGLVILGETAGLLGACLKRSPAAADEPTYFFDHPRIQTWLRFAPERVHERTLALVAGIAVKAVSQDYPSIEPFVRPMKADSDIQGHFHAAAFTYRALPKGRLPLEKTLATIFEEQSLLGVLHLLNDTRPLVGGGESLFLRGAIWLAPISTFTRAPIKRSAADPNKEHTP